MYRRKFFAVQQVVMDCGLSRELWTYDCDEHDTARRPVLGSTRDAATCSNVQQYEATSVTIR